MLSVIYLIFTEGSSASSGDDLIRLDLASEAQRLARVLTRLVPDEPEVHGLLALLELTAARFPARTGPDGEPVLLEHQDRRRWDRAAIRRGRAALARAEQVGRGLGAYGLQAAIAECHAVAPSVDATNWERDRAPLRGARPARAVTGGRPQPGGGGLHGPGTGRGAARSWTSCVAAQALSNSHLLPSVRGELLTRLGRTDEARTELELAVRLCGNERERTVLERKLADLG